MARYERIIFMQESEAEEALDILDEEGEDAAIEFLAQWHNPGEHETSDEESAGDDDDVYEDDDGYILSWNSRIGYIGLEYDTEADEED